MRDNSFVIVVLILAWYLWWIDARPPVKHS